MSVFFLEFDMIMIDVLLKFEYFDMFYGLV